MSSGSASSAEAAMHTGGYPPSPARLMKSFICSRLSCLHRIFSKLTCCSVTGPTILSLSVLYESGEHRAIWSNLESFTDRKYWMHEHFTAVSMRLESMADSNLDISLSSSSSERNLTVMLGLLSCTLKQVFSMYLLFPLSCVIREKCFRVSWIMLMMQPHSMLERNSSTAKAVL